MITKLLQILGVSMACCTWLQTSMAESPKAQSGTESAHSHAVESLYDLTVPGIDGTPVALGTYRGKVSLVVNVASHCGFTPQYTGLEALYKRFEPRGFVILGFPSNDFGQQEPGSNAEIKSFCTNTYGVTFPLFAKGTVLGGGKQEIYRLLTQSTGGSEVEWNFEKFLVGRDGKVIGRFPPSTTPDSQKLADAIEAALAAN